MKFLIKPFPAVRVNGKRGRFAPRAKQYHEKMNILRRLIGNDDATLIIKMLFLGNCKITFGIEMPKSRSDKKKIEYIGTPHKATPDIDNLYKAFTDTVFFGRDQNDSGISIINARKVRSDVGYIEID